MSLADIGPKQRADMKHWTLGDVRNRRRLGLIGEEAAHSRMIFILDAWVRTLREIRSLPSC